MNRKLKLDLQNLEIESFDTSGVSALNTSGTVQGHTATGVGDCYSHDPGAYTICGTPENCGGGTHLALGCGGGDTGNDTMDPASIFCYSFAAPCPDTRQYGGC